MARVLGSVPAQLALQVPEPGTEGFDKVFRRGFAAWVNALRQPPNLTVKISAGSVSFSSPFSAQKANAIEVLALRRTVERYERLPTFGAPDVSNETYTRAVVDGAPAGDELDFYIVSRLAGASVIAHSLQIETAVKGSSSASKARIWTEGENSSGKFLAYDWLKVLTGRSGNKGLQFALLMGTSLRSRLEDEVSFRFNIASPSGNTSFLGRCKTVVDRASIDSSHQPDAPPPPLKVLPPKSVQSFGSGSFGSVASAPTVFSYGSSPAPAPSGRLFGSAPAPAFGGSPTLCAASASFGSSPVRAPSSGLFRSAPLLPSGALFGSAPVPAQFGSAPASFGGIRSASALADKVCSLTSTTRAAPSWLDAMKVPVGSNLPLLAQDYSALKRAMAEIVHARRRLLRDQTINFFCDVCKHQFEPGEDRYHCFDCQDFDVCSRCRDRHELPFHRVALISPTLNLAGAAAVKDPLVDILLKPTPGSFAPSAPTVSSQPPRIDQGVIWCNNRLRRFLYAVLHWWPVFRAMCAFRDRLPIDVSQDLVERLASSVVAGENLNELLKTVTIVVDSLMREDGNLLNVKADSGFANNN